MLSLGNKLSLSTAKTTYENSFSADLDGTNDFVDCANDSSIRITGDMSVSFWIKTTEGSNTTIIAKDDNDANKNWFIQLRSNGKIRWLVVSGGSNVSKDSATADLDNGAWRHVVCTIAVAETMIIYIDGSADATKSSGVPETIDNDTVNMTIGARANASQPIDAFIDEVAIFNRSLAANEVTAIYNGGRPIDISANVGNYTSSSSLKGYWRFEEGTGTIAYDSSGNDNTGTMTNGATYNTDTP